MRPHPLFMQVSIPATHLLGDFTLRRLTVADVDRDFVAVMESAADIRSSNPDSTWPQGLTRDENFLDLAWHQREFESKRSFTWVIEDAGGEYLGCLYVYPSLAGDRSADVFWWWRTGAIADRAALPGLLRQWFSGAPWPELTFHLKSK
jgi:hypothetical protein